MNKNNLSFNYLPLTFISSDNEIKNHIVNTIIFKYIQDKYQDVRKLGELLIKSQYGFTASAQEIGNVRFLRISDIKNNKVNWTTVPYCDCNNINYLLKKEDILVARTGGTTGKSFYIDEISENSVFASYLIRLTAGNEINPKFIMLFFNSYIYWNQISTMKSGSAQPNVNAEKLKTLLIPYCSLELQEKFIKLSENINSNIEELKPLVNKIENALSQYSLIKEQKNIIEDNFKLIENLRQSIFQEAVEGKLVEQDPNDEPASELLKKIQVEKENLIKEGKRKKEKPLDPINIDDITFNIPNGWKVIKLGEISLIERGGSPRPIDDFITEDLDGLNWIKIGDTDKNGKYITSTKEKIKKEGLFKTRMVYPGDFLLTNSMSFGRPYITKIQGCIHDGWLRISPSNSLNKDYLYNLLSSSLIKKGFEDVVSGAVVQNLNSEKVKNTIILLPPLEEQKRIVVRVEQLMTLCDELEERIKQSKEINEELLESLLHDSFSKQ